MRYFTFLMALLLFSCDNEKIIELPEVKNSDTTEVLDVSPAYIFYDTTQPDSTLLNRKNVISTTNWLVNIDKRLSLKQVLPHIQYLQNKRRKASMHKNENAKNYFTCNDTTIKNLGFLEFTQINYYSESLEALPKNEVIITFDSLDFVSTSIPYDSNFKFSKIKMESLLDRIDDLYSNSTEIVLVFNSAMSFQDYITIKSEMRLFEARTLKDEFFY